MDLGFVIVIRALKVRNQLGPFVKVERGKVDNAMISGLLNSREIKSDFNSKMLSFNVVFISY